MTETVVETRFPSRARRWMSRRRLPFVAGGMLLLQLVWVFAVPPFRGSDEFDHVYRAAAVARGEWAPPPTEATRGTGAWLHVPRDIVKAAFPQCDDLIYTKAVDCVGTPAANGEQRVASGAGRYHPFFYAIVGTPSLPFEGHAALYAMRLMTVLISWLMFCAALAAVNTWSRTPWPVVGVVLAATPVLIYSTSVVAPNGFELMGALALWAALLGLGFGSANKAGDHLLLGITAVAGSVVATTRSLGPLWCLLIVLTVLVATRPSWARVRELFSGPWAWVAAAAVGAVTLQSVWWIRSMGSLNIGEIPQQSYSFGDRMGRVAGDVLLWLFQSIAAFPLRDERSPILLYACFLAIFALFLALALRARSHLRIAIVLATIGASAVPFFIVVATYNKYADLWQGRYGLPYAIGIAVLCGAALDRASARLGPRLRFTIAVLFVVGQTIGPVSVLRQGLGHRLDDFGQWVRLPVFVCGTLAAGGAMLLIWFATHRAQDAEITS